MEAPKISLLETLKTEIENLDLFTDKSERIVYTKIKGSLKKIDSSEVKGLITSKVFALTKKLISSENYETIKRMVIFEKKTAGLIQVMDIYERKGGNPTIQILYDLCNENNQIVEIDTKGWEVTENGEMFLRSNKMMPQPTPVFCENRQVLEKHFQNCPDKDTLILLLVTIIARFIPGIEQPLLYYHGSMGSAKSTLAKKEKMIVDPSTTPLKVLPKVVDEIAISVSKDTVSIFDNISSINKEVSDLLCLVVTGGVYNKRKLYTDDEETIIQLKSAVSMTGIDVWIKKPDLFDRSILIELERIEDSQYISKEELEAELLKDMPEILGYTFGIIHKAMKLYPEIKPKNSSRLSSYYKWACCIAEAMEYGLIAFEDAFANNRKEITKKVLQENYLGELVVSYVKEQKKDEITLSSSELYEELKKIATLEKNLDDFPRTANVFGKKIKEIKTDLKNSGIEVESGKTNRNKTITLRKLPNFDKINSVETFEDYI